MSLGTAEGVIGEIKYGHEIGKKEWGGHPTKYILLACANCGKKRWRVFRKKQSSKCMSCRQKGILNRAWKGGRYKHPSGYIYLWLRPDDFFFPMAQASGYVKEHRLIMAKSLGRNLHRWEIVHHKNGIKDDNRIENLQLVTDDRHMQITLLEIRISYLEKRVILLEGENILLREKIIGGSLC